MNRTETIPDKPWAQTPEAALQELCSDMEQGLDAAEAERRFGRYGRNQLSETKKRGWFSILTAQFKSLIVLLLAGAAVLAFAMGDIPEGIAVIIVILLNAAIGFTSELKAVRSMEALAKIGNVLTRVLRNGAVRYLEAQFLVPGDIVVIESGDILTADMRLLEASKVQADESALTGESLPVAKKIAPTAEETVLAERTNMLYKGTAVVRGSGLGMVTATGMQTELGRISSLVEATEEESTPLEKRLNRLGNLLIWVTLGIVAVTALGGVLAGKDLVLMIETAIALAVAAIPEGLPIVATLALARGMWRMARRNALINRLSAVETLGATNIICTDKTGTLTENRMTVDILRHEGGDVSWDSGSAPENGILENDPILHRCMEVSVLCNNASLRPGIHSGPKGASGDPLEIALLLAARRAGMEKDAVEAEMPEIREEAFDSDVKMMATYHEDRQKRIFVAVKGAPEAVIASSASIQTSQGVRELRDEDRSRWIANNAEMAKGGLRTLALACKYAETAEARPYQNLTFLGLIGMLDPPREDIREAIGLCRNAGIRVIMVTGDQIETAKNVAQKVGLVDSGQVSALHGSELRSPEELSDEETRRLRSVPIFARVSPKQKLDLIGIHQQNHSVVAMTGDGVNDAPALKKADIGIAMGERGTQVAKEASDMVLKDDAFRTIVTAVEQGRVIFNNIRRFIVYLLSCNISEILIVSLASFMGIPLPILPLQILFLNLVTDIFPALALGFGEGDANIMVMAPRGTRENLIVGRWWGVLAASSAIMTLSVLGALLLALRWLGLPEAQATTVSFLTLAFAQLWHTFNMRDPQSPFLSNEITRNPYIWGSIGVCSLLLLIAAYLPGLSSVLNLAPPGKAGWLLILIMSLVPLVLGQAGLAAENLLGGRRTSRRKSGP